MPDGSSVSITEAGPVPHLGILSRTRAAAPVLPLRVLGDFWSRWIMETAEGANAPPDYVVAPLLTLASALIGNARWARAWPGWDEPPILWCASVGNPSSGKSPGAAPITRDAVANLEAHVGRTYPDEWRKWQESESIAEVVHKQWKRDVAKAIKEGEGVPDKPPLAEPPAKPIRLRLRVSDTTVEKLALILADLPKGVLCTREELAGWLMNLSRYSNGSDRPFWLEAYTGGSHQVDRVKQEEPVRIERLTCALFGTIQPDRLAEVTQGADDGLTGRFLWAWPDAKPFARPSGGGDIRQAAERLTRLADMVMMKGNDGRPRPSFVPLDDDAATLLADFALEMQARENTTHGMMKSAIGKARGQSLRLAIVLEYLWWCTEPGVEPATISANAMRDAIDLMRTYFLPMAERVLGDAAISQGERNARTLARWIVDTGAKEVNVSTIRDHARLDSLREAAPVRAACAFLSEAGWLLPKEQKGPGRPRGDHSVNPILWSMLRRKDQDSPRPRSENTKKGKNPPT